MNSYSQSTYIHLSDLDNATLTQRVYRNLCEDTLATRLLPGTSLTEIKLATALGVNRGPVREEFLDTYCIREALVTERRLERTDGHGTFVTELSAALHLLQHFASYADHM